MVEKNWWFEFAIPNVLVGARPLHRISTTMLVLEGDVWGELKRLDHHAVKNNYMIYCNLLIQ